MYRIAMTYIQPTVYRTRHPPFTISCPVQLISFRLLPTPSSHRVINATAKVYCYYNNIISFIIVDQTSHLPSATYLTLSAWNSLHNDYCPRQVETGIQPPVCPILSCLVSRRWRLLLPRPSWSFHRAWCPLLHRSAIMGPRCHQVRL